MWFSHGSEAAWCSYCISHIIDGLQQAQPRSSIVLLHDGLLVSPLPSQSTLARLNEESLSLAGLRNDDYPFLRITNLQDLYTQIVRQLPPITEQDLESLRAAIATVNLTHLRHHQPQHHKPLVEVPFPLPQQRPRCMPTSDE